VKDSLTRTLENIQKDVESGVANAEAELADLRARCEQLQELIGIGKTTIYAAKQTSAAGYRQADTPATDVSNGQLGVSEHVIRELQKHLS
jgi:hypothetical protein